MDPLDPLARPFAGIGGHTLTTDVPYFFRVSAHGPGGWGVAKISSPIAIAPVAQIPYLPEIVRVEVSQIDIAPQLDVWFQQPNVNNLKYVHAVLCVCACVCGQARSLVAGCSPTTTLPLA